MTKDGREIPGKPWENRILDIHFLHSLTRKDESDNSWWASVELVMALVWAANRIFDKPAIGANINRHTGDVCEQQVDVRLTRLLKTACRLFPADWCRCGCAAVSEMRRPILISTFRFFCSWRGVHFTLDHLVGHSDFYLMTLPILYVEVTLKTFFSRPSIMSSCYESGWKNFWTSTGFWTLLFSDFILGSQPDIVSLCMRDVWRSAANVSLRLACALDVFKKKKKCRSEEFQHFWQQSCRILSTIKWLSKASLHTTFSVLLSSFSNWFHSF